MYTAEKERKRDDGEKEERGEERVKIVNQVHDGKISAIQIDIQIQD